MKIDKQLYHLLTEGERAMLPQWFQNSNHDDMLISLTDDDQIIVHMGIWRYGNFRGGLWEDGIFQGGRFISGVWKGGVWKGGTFEDSIQLGARSYWVMSHGGPGGCSIRIGCQYKTVEDWDKFFAPKSRSKFQHKRNSPEFKHIREQYYWYKEHILKIK